MVSKTRVRSEKQSEVNETAAPTLNPRLDGPQKNQDTGAFFSYFFEKCREKSEKSQRWISETRFRIEKQSKATKIVALTLAVPTLNAI